MYKASPETIAIINEVIDLYLADHNIPSDAALERQIQKPRGIVWRWRNGGIGPTADALIPLVYHTCNRKTTDDEIASLPT